MTAITKSDHVRRQNRRLVLSVMRGAGSISRTEIHERTHLSPSTVSAITSDMIAEGVLREAAETDGAAVRRGRPQVALEIDPDAASIVAVLLSLNALSASLIDYAGAPLRSVEQRLDTLALSQEGLMAAVRTMVGDLLDRAAKEGRRVLRIAFAIQGITDSAARLLLWSPITPHSDIPFGDDLERRFGIPVTVENDCNMIALALQARDGSGERRDFVAVLLSHGIGMGLVLKGEMFTGTRSSGGEFGHMNHMPDGALCRCGRRGCVEAYAGNYAIWRNAFSMPQDAVPATDIGEEEIRAIARAARRGPGAEREAFRVAGEAIGFGLGSLFALIDPAPVAMVGHGVHAFDLMEGPMREAIGKTAGGQHRAEISFTTEPNEFPLILEGCAVRALSYVDREIVAPGLLVRADRGKVTAAE